MEFGARGVEDQMRDKQRQTYFLGHALPPLVWFVVLLAAAST